MQLRQIAYIELWLMHHVAQARLNPWERYLPQSPDGKATPSQVQRDAQRILSLIGTKSPKPQGNSSGRVAGTHVPRKCHPVIKKGKKLPFSHLWRNRPKYHGALPKKVSTYF